MCDPYILFVTFKQFVFNFVSDHYVRTEETGITSDFILIFFKSNVGLSFIPKNLTLLHWNNKGADQPVYQRSLIFAFVINPLTSLAMHDMYKCTVFCLVYVAVKTRLNHT